MTTTAGLSPTDRFNSLMEGLFTDVATEVPKSWIAIPVITLVWRRLRRMVRRFNTIMARFRAGALPAPDSAPAGAAVARPAAAPRPAHGSRPLELPRRKGWVIQAISWFLLVRHYELEEMLDDPETAALVADAPQLGSVLRPMCRLMGVKKPAWLRLPRRARRRVVETIPSAPDWLVNEPGAQLRADGTVWMRLGASTKWRPGFGQTLEEAQKFDLPVKIWPRED